MDKSLDQKNVAESPSNKDIGLVLLFLVTKAALNPPKHMVLHTPRCTPLCSRDVATQMSIKAFAQKYSSKDF